MGVQSRLDRFAVWQDQRTESFVGPELTMDHERGLVVRFGQYSGSYNS